MNWPRYFKIDHVLCYIQEVGGYHQPTFAHYSVKELPPGRRERKVAVPLIERGDIELLTIHTPPEYTLFLLKYSNWRWTHPFD
jgi:hypothetical protein